MTTPEATAPIGDPNKGKNLIGKNFGKFLFGSKTKVKQAKTVSPQQEELMALIQQGLSKGEGPFGDLFKDRFNEEEFQKGVANPALKNFQESILPSLNEKFIAGNQVGGSGMRRAQQKAAVDLQDRLAQLRYGAMNQGKEAQQRNQFAGINSLLGKNTQENLVQQGETGAVQSLFSGIGKGIGTAAGTAIAG